MKLLCNVRCPVEEEHVTSMVAIEICIYSMVAIEICIYSIVAIEICIYSMVATVY